MGREEQGCSGSSGTKQAQVDCCLVCVGIAGAFGQDLPSWLCIWELSHFFWLHCWQLDGCGPWPARCRCRTLGLDRRRLRGTLLRKALHMLHVLHLLKWGGSRLIRRVSLQLRRKHLVLWMRVLWVLRIASHLLCLLRLHLLLALLLLAKVSLLGRWCT